MTFLSKSSRLLGSIIFWAWNIAFVIVVLFGVFPMIGAAIIEQVFLGDLPIDFLIGLVIVAVVPIAMLVLGFTKIRKQPHALIRYFYGVEAPIFLLCLIRLTMLRELTIASAFLIASILIAAVFYFFLLQDAKGQKELRAPKIYLGASAILLTTAGYAGALLVIYALPAAFIAMKAVIYTPWNFIRWLPLLSLYDPLILLAILLFFLSFALFILTPIFIVVFYGQAWKRIWFMARRTVSWPAGAGIIAFSASIWMGIFWATNVQPQTEIFALLQQPAVTQEQKKAIIDSSQEVRRGLLNAYLYRYRYLAATQRLDGVSALYVRILGVSKEAGRVAQAIHDFLISPVLYHGGADDDVAAEKYYSQIFDAQIQKRESAVILKALNATAWRDGVEAGLLNINQKKVWLAEQRIVVATNDGAADVEVYEVYENATKNLQEIFYYFSLPENAAVTGLWLGASSDRDKRDAYVVSPRGAAQKVYANQLKERMDPALLEQVGPRQYRLRAFPIPPKASSGEASQRLHLWLTYSVLKGEREIFPKLLEKRNIFWTEKTKRFLNGQEYFASDRWTPDSDGDLQKITPPQAFSVAVGGYLVSAQPFAAPPEPRGAKIALLIDSSFSMARQQAQVLSALEELSKREPGAQADVFIAPVSEPLRKIDDPKVALGDFTFFGFLSDADLWNQAAAIQKIDAYQAVFIVTDQGSYELSKNKPVLSESSAPVWFVHLGRLAPAYEDGLAKNISVSGGGVASSLSEAWRDFIARQNNPPFARTHGDMLWSFSPLPSEVQDGASHPLAAKMLIEHLALEPGAQKLDLIHAIARENSVATPYSSMIVLVNQRQKDELKKAEQGQDRFDRAVDAGVENLGKPNNPLVSGAPEPETWILLTLSLFALAALRKRDVFAAHNS